MEKLLDEMTVKLGRDAKRTLVALAEMDGLSASELVRNLIQRHIDDREQHFRALNTVFGQKDASHNVGHEGT
jgi:predicted DNA-binding protein